MLERKMLNHGFLRHDLDDIIVDIFNDKSKTVNDITINFQNNLFWDIDDIIVLFIRKKRLNIFLSKEDLKNTTNIINNAVFSNKFNYDDYLYLKKIINDYEIKIGLI